MQVVRLIQMKNINTNVQINRKESKISASKYTASSDAAFRSHVGTNKHGTSNAMQNVN